MAEGLARLHDKLPPFSYKEVTHQIQTQLGGPIPAFFSAFSLQPVAAASIAQVHKATTLAGQVVAVKILRPNIERQVARDLALFSWLASCLERWMPAARRLKPVETIAWFKDSVMLELDLRFEAAAASELKENCVDDPEIYIPAIDWQLSNKRVMTMEWVEGISIYDHAGLIAAGHKLETIASRLAIGFFNQAYRDGFFHADMHPGNLFVRADGSLALVDFGIMGRMDEATRIYVAEILRGFLKRDYKHVARIHFEAGYVPPHKDMGMFAQALRSIGEPIVGQPVSHISVGKLLAQLFQVTEDFEMETQPQLLLLQKTTLLVEGVGHQLNPKVNLWQLAEPWIEDWVVDNITPEAKLMRMARYAVARLTSLSYGASFSPNSHGNPDWGKPMRGTREAHPHHHHPWQKQRTHPMRTIGVLMLGACIGVVTALAVMAVIIAPFVFGN
jgi:ubiquinone biosynthesis protein